MFKIESEAPEAPGTWVPVETAHNYATAVQVAQRAVEGGAESVRYFDPSYPHQTFYLPTRREGD